MQGDRRGRSRPAAFVLLLFSVFLPPAPAVAGENRLPFLSALEVGSIEDATEPREIRLFHRNGRELFSHLTIARSYRVDDLGEYLRLPDPSYSFPGESGLEPVAPTLVADYHHQAFAGIREEIVARHGENPTPANLSGYVHDYIVRKTYTRGFDIAARVAATREGDCTEHTVLLMALLRMFGNPARMVVGVKLLEAENHYLAFGHAWVEYFHQGGWQAADPTLAVEVDSTYIPVGILEQEGLNFRMGLISLIQRMPYRIELAGRAP
jgi:hypothetical protein